MSFRTDGGRKCAGRIRIVENGNVLTDEALATKVIPTFEVTPPMPELK